MKLFWLLATPWLAGTATAQEPTKAGASQRDTAKVREFVEQTYVCGVPYDEAVQLGPGATKVLLGLLSDSSQRPNWSNIAVTLGMLGSEEATDSLISFVESGNAATLLPEIYRAKTDALMSLGYIANNPSNRSALNYLLAGVKPTFWIERRIMWLAPNEKSESGRNLRLSKIAILGLALSGRPEAGTALQTLVGRTPSAGHKKATDPLAPVAEGALREYSRISRQGLKAYYSGSSKR